MPLDSLVYRENRNTDSAVLLSEGYTVALVMPHPNSADLADGAAHRARRLAAAVNACAGLPVEALEAFSRSGVLGRYWADQWELAFNGGQMSEEEQKADLTAMRDRSLASRSDAEDAEVRRGREG